MIGKSKNQEDDKNILFFLISFGLLFILLKCSDDGEICKPYRNPRGVFRLPLTYANLYEDGVLDIGYAATQYEGEDAFDEQNLSYIQDRIQRFLQHEGTSLQDYCIKLHEINTPGEFGLALSQYDIVVYKGHSRWGLGPAIRSPTDYFFLDHIQPFSVEFVFLLYTYLIEGWPPYDPFGQNNHLSQIDVAAKVVVFMGCESEQYFRQAFNRYAPNTLFLGTPAVVDATDDHMVHFLQGIIMGLDWKTMLAHLNLGYISTMQTNDQGKNIWVPLLY